MPVLFDTPPRIELDVSGLTGTTVTIIRTDAAGNACPVRSANPAALSAGEWVGYDYEAPFGVELWYTATTDTADTDTVGPLVLDVQAPWLIHPGIPALSQPITIATLGDRTTDTNAGVHQVLERENPLVINDGIRHGSTFAMTLKTDVLDDEDALRTLLGDGSPLLLQRVYPWRSKRDYWWISIGQVVAHDLTDDISVPSTRWSMDCTVVDMPAGTLQATWTWADVIAGYATWNDVVASFATWRDVITDSPS